MASRAVAPRAAANRATAESPETELVAAIRADVEARHPGGPRPLYSINDFDVGKRTWVSDGKIASLEAVENPFRAERDITTNDIKSAVEHWEHSIILDILRTFEGRLILAGGAVLDAIQSVINGKPVMPNDFDIFILAETPDEANAIRHDLVVFIGEQLRIKAHLFATAARSRHRGADPENRFELVVSMRQGTTTIEGGQGLKIQVIHRLNANPEDILYAFDLGASAVGAWYESGVLQVCASAMGRFALRYGMNVFGSMWASRSYPYRLSKYIREKGFGIILPEAEPDAFRAIEVYDWDSEMPISLGVQVELGPYVVGRTIGYRQIPVLYSRTRGDRSDYEVETKNGGIMQFNNIQLREMMAGRAPQFHVRTDIRTVGTSYGVFAHPDEWLGVSADIDFELFAAKALTTGPHLFSSGYIVTTYARVERHIEKSIASGTIPLREIRRYLPEYDVLPIVGMVQGGAGREQIDAETKKIVDALREQRVTSIRAAASLENYPTEWVRLTPATGQGFRLSGSFHPIAYTPEEMYGKVFRPHEEITPLFESVLPIARGAELEASGGAGGSGT